MCLLFFITYLKWFLLKSVTYGTGMPMPDWGSWLLEEMPMPDLIFSGITAFPYYFSRSYSKNIHHQQPTMECRVYHFSLPAVTTFTTTSQVVCTCRVYHCPLSLQFRRAGCIPFTNTGSLDVQGVSLSPPPTPAVRTYRVSLQFPVPAIHMDMQNVSLSTDSNMDVQGVSLSTPSSMDVHGVSIYNASSLYMQGESTSPLPTQAVWTCRVPL